jgi:tyrosinase
MYERRDVWTLSDEHPWHPTLEWYARAVDELRARPASDPAGWEYLAAIHGRKPGAWPPGATWNQCRHGSWFFLPWHRVYLHYFETVVRQAVRQLGGPDDWTVPYWDYSDARQPNARRLPPAFREPHLPGGKPNPLFAAQRDPRMNAGEELGRGAVDVGPALKPRNFELGAGRPGFGGARPPAEHGEGSLENVPHGAVHMGVAGPRDGWMGRFATAGLDPVFWLHHANIDRLWEVWRGMEGHDDPADAAWRDARFTLGHGPGAVSLTTREVLDVSRPPLGYRYSSVAPPEGRFAVRLDTKPLPRRRTRGGGERVVPAEMVGASDAAVPLGAAPSEVQFAVESRGARVFKSFRVDDAGEPEVFLKVENVRGLELAAGGYVLYLNLPAGSGPDDHPERRAGEISLFGVREASAAGGEHGGSGLTFTLDVTEVARLLRGAGDWSPDRLRVTFVPVQRGPRDEVVDGDARVGRVSVFQA